jgi:hypothetical protein
MFGAGAEHRRTSNSLAKGKRERRPDISGCDGYPLRRLMTAAL